MNEEKKLKIERIGNIVVTVLIDARDELVERKVNLTNMLDPYIGRLEDYVNEIYNKENFVIDDVVGIVMKAVYCEAIKED